MTKVVLVDAGGSNIGSVRYALQRLGMDAELTGDAATIRAADRVILPGVGAAAVCMARLRELDLVDVLRTLDRPLLGVCVGVQLLFAHSEEDDTPCLGLLPGRVRKLHAAPGIRVPHMGWNRLRPLQPSLLLRGVPERASAYFVHSYAAPLNAHTVAACEHGGLFTAVVEKDGRFGAQFHPERSADTGSQMLRNFLEGTAV